jgi:hypothetical protein
MVLCIAAFVQRLRELGWIEGRTVAIDNRRVDGRTERFAEIAAEFVRLNVNVIVTSGTPAVMALQHATSVIPIVFATAGDPVNSGLVASLARPGWQPWGTTLLASGSNSCTRLCLPGSLFDKFQSRRARRLRHMLLEPKAAMVVLI